MIRFRSRNREFTGIIKDFENRGSRLLNGYSIESNRERVCLEEVFAKDK